MKNESYYVINGFMINELKLKGNDLIVYAIINQFSQDGQGTFSGSLNYLCESTGASRRTIIDTLSKLVKRDLIKKHTDRLTNGEKRCTYIVCRNCTNLVQNLHQPSAEIAPPSAEIAPNKKENNLLNNNINKYNVENLEQFHKYICNSYSSVAWDLFFSKTKLSRDGEDLYMTFDTPSIYNSIMSLNREPLFEKINRYNRQNGTNLSLHLVQPKSMGV